MEGRRVLQHMTVEQNLIIRHMFPSASAMRQALERVAANEAIPRLAYCSVQQYAEPVKNKNRPSPFV